MRYIGIDIAKKMHAVAILDERGEVKAGPFTINNTASGFQKLLERFEKTGASSDECLIGMEATGHYWIALFDFQLNGQGVNQGVRSRRSGHGRRLAGRFHRTLQSVSNGRSSEVVEKIGVSVS